MVFARLDGKEGERHRLYIYRRKGINGLSELHIMSSITNVQNLITNVFRPVYVYNSSGGFQPKMEMSNIDTYIGNETQVKRVQVIDPSTNSVYVGFNAGNSFSNPNLCSNVVALGVSAAQSAYRVSNSVYIGTNAGILASNVTNNIAIGISALAGTSSNAYSNIVIGNTSVNTPYIWNNNILIGHNITNQFTSNTSNVLQISNLIYGNFANKWMGVGTPTQSIAEVNLDVSGGVAIAGKLGIQMTPANSLNVNGQTQSTGGFYSLTGSTPVIPTGGSNMITTLQQGLLIATAMSTTMSNFSVQNIFVRDATGVLAPVVISQSNQGLSFYIPGGSSNVYISNSSGSNVSVNWSITVFPLVSQ
jgi:hypothetical protein